MTDRFPWEDTAGVTRSCSRYCLVSSGGCATSVNQGFVEDFGWFEPAECLSWTVVEFVGDGVEFGLGVVR
jgi:hypothetical protein